ncbi:MAG: CPBP family intramembrane glutamic endopeptidase [Microcoleus sp.]
MLNSRSRKTACLALILLVPAATISILTGLYAATEIWGQKLSFLCQVWLLIFPIAWSLCVDRFKFRFSPPKYRELVAGFIWGILMFAVIIGVYKLFGQGAIDPVTAREKARQLGINSPTIYFIVEAYFVLINSLIEEFTWRWFVCNKCQILMPGTGAIFLSSLFFTLHHIFVLAAYTQGWIVILGSLAVFTAGVIWSQCYLTYRSLWSSYISHAIADLALAIIAWQILFS